MSKTIVLPIGTGLTLFLLALLILSMPDVCLAQGIINGCIKVWESYDHFLIGVMWFIISLFLLGSTKEGKLLSILIGVASAIWANLYGSYTMFSSFLSVIWIVPLLFIFSIIMKLSKTDIGGVKGKISDLKKRIPKSTWVVIALYLLLWVFFGFIGAFIAIIILAAALTIGKAIPPVKLLTYLFIIFLIINIPGGYISWKNDPDSINWMPGHDRLKKVYEDVIDKIPGMENLAEKMLIVTGKIIPEEKIGKKKYPEVKTQEDAEDQIPELVEQYNKETDPNIKDRIKKRAEKINKIYDLYDLDWS